MFGNVRMSWSMTAPLSSLYSLILHKSQRPTTFHIPQFLYAQFLWWTMLNIAHYARHIVHCSIADFKKEKTNKKNKYAKNAAHNLLSSYTIIQDDDCFPYAKIALRLKVNGCNLFCAGVLISIEHDVCSSW